jgi:hypothetical protein
MNEPAFDASTFDHEWLGNADHRQTMKRRSGMRISGLDKRPWSQSELI